MTFVDYFFYLSTCSCKAAVLLVIVPLNVLEETKYSTCPPPFSPQLEESNRTLTVDVANLANEKEELNNQLKEMQQRESSRSWDLLSPALRPTVYKFEFNNN